MPQCAVKGCKSHTSRTPKGEVSYFIFPRDPIRCKKWASLISKQRQEPFTPSPRSVVCSLHFLSKDMYGTPKGLNKLYKSALPQIDVPNVHDIQDSENDESDICRICLTANSKLSSMTEHKLDIAFEYLTGININNYDYLPNKICKACAQKLRSFKKFRDSSLAAHTKMLNEYKKRSSSKSKTTKPNKIKSETKNLVEVIVKEEGGIIEGEELFDITEDSAEELRIKKENEQENTQDPILVSSTKDETDNYKTEILYENENQNSLKMESKSFNYEITTEDSTIEENDQFSSGEDSEEYRPKIKKKRTKKKTEKTEVKKEPKGTKFSFLKDENVLKLFSISKLRFEEQIAELEKRKDSYTYKKSVFRCSECFKGFSEQEAFDSHMLRHSDVEGEFPCKVCKLRFKTRETMHHHESSFHAYRYSCNKCPLVTLHRATAKQHRKWHSGSSYTCPHCNEVFAVKSTYLGHIRIRHPSDFACELCGYSFLSITGVQVHKRKIHRNDDRKVPEDGPLCDLCNIRFLNEEVYEQHIRVSTKHNPMKRTRTRRNFKLKGSCEVCGIQLENSEAYNLHFKTMHPDVMRARPSYTKFVCEQCGKTFTCQSMLADHAWSHTSEMLFKCDVCDKRFKTKLQMKGHIRAVHDGQKYACNYCGKKFSIRSNLVRHIYTHAGLKPYKCDLCDKRFTDPCTRKLHVKHEHFKEPYPKRKQPRIRKPQVHPMNDYSLKDL